MKIQDTYQLIARLKQQPRHGADPLPGDLGDPAGVTLGGIVGLGGAAIDTVAAIAKLTTSVAGLNKALIISTGLEKAQAGVQALNTAYKNLVSPSLKLEKSNASLNKSFGINSVAAAGLAGKLQTIANTYGLTSEQVKQYAVNIKSMLPLMNQQTNTGTAFYEGLQKTQDILKTNLGLSDDQTNSYSEYAAAANNTADTTLMVAKRVAEAFGDNAQGDLGYFKMITGEIADAGSEIQLQYGKIPGSLESAVIKSKKFGLSLQNLQSAATNLLNIEASIGQELEYQLLSGHRLVDTSGKSLTNAYREATLRGDMNAQADAMNTIIEQEGAVLENNLFARKQMSQLLGVDEKQLASAIQKKKILDKAAASGITIDLNGSGALEQAAAAVEAGALSPEDFESLKKATDTRTTDDRLEQILKVNEEQLFYDKLLNQQAIIKATSESATGNAPGLGGFEKSYATLEAIGTAYMAMRTGIAAGTLPTNILNAATMAEGGVVPPGYPNDTYPALLSSDETVMPPQSLDTVMNNVSGDGMQKFAAMIVAAINNQTAQLKQNDRIFTGGMNAPYYG
jgi:hypothetical protein